jgi:hypothetical protein
MQGGCNRDRPPPRRGRPSEATWTYRPIAAANELTISLVIAFGPRRESGEMASTVQEYVAEREIDCLVHFTRASNLDSILQRGLLPRDILMVEGYNDFNDQYRHDGTNAVCLSIGFPNYKMFFSLRQPPVPI